MSSGIVLLNDCTGARVFNLDRGAVRFSEEAVFPAGVLASVNANNVAGRIDGICDPLPRFV
jgi:hypothetical protein